MAFSYSGDLRYVKLYLLLVEGGTFASKKHILKILNSDNTLIDHCLLNSKDVIKGALTKKHISSKQWDILFPQASIPTDLECWDVSLHTYILLNIFNKKMDKLEVIAFRALRDKRNELAHRASTIMSEEKFLGEWSQVTMLLFQLTRGLTLGEQKDSNDIVSRIASIAYYDNAASELKSFEGSDKLYDLISEKLNSHERQMKEVFQRLDEFDDFKRDIENGQLNIAARMTVSASTQTARNTAQTKLFRATSASLGHGQTDDDEVLTAVNNLFSDIRDEGVDIGKVEEGSVLVTLCCPTIQALKKISQYFANKMYNERLKELESALSDCVQWPVKLNINIVLETLCLALSQIEKYSKSVVLSLKCKGPEGVRTAMNLLLNRTSSNPVHRISDALSRAIGQRIEVHTAIDTHKLESDIAKPKQKLTIDDRSTEKHLTTGLNGLDNGETGQEQHVQEMPVNEIIYDRKEGWVETNDLGAPPIPLRTYSLDTPISNQSEAGQFDSNTNLKQLNIKSDMVKNIEFGGDGPENKAESSDDNSMASDCEETERSIK